MTQRAVDLLVTGTVQGVFFRASTVEAAERAGVAGWVRNEPDGSVRAHAEGPADAVQQLVDWCRVGPPAARVDDVRVTEAAPEGLTGFSQRAGGGDDGRPRVRGLDHVVLVAHDVERTLWFYSVVLGAEIRGRGAWQRGEADHAILRFGDDALHVRAREADAAPRTDAAGPHLALGWDGTAADAVRHLEAKGVEGVGAAATTVTFRDPDGVLVELVCSGA